MLLLKRHSFWRHAGAILSVSSTTVCQEVKHTFVAAGAATVAAHFGSAVSSPAELSVRGSSSVVGFGPHAASIALIPMSTTINLLPTRAQLV